MFSITLIVLLGATHLLPAVVEANKQVSNNISIDMYSVRWYKLSYPTIV